MRQPTGTRKNSGEKLVKDIKRATRKQYSSEEKIRIVLDGLMCAQEAPKICLITTSFCQMAWTSYQTVA